MQSQEHMYVRVESIKQQHDHSIYGTRYVYKQFEVLINTIPLKLPLPTSTIISLTQSDHWKYPVSAYSTYLRPLTHKQLLADRQKGIPTNHAPVMQSVAFGLFIACFNGLYCLYTEILQISSNIFYTYVCNNTVRLWHRSAQHHICDMWKNQIHS